MANLYKKAAERQKIVPGGTKNDPEDVKEEEITVPGSEEEACPDIEIPDNKSIEIPLDEIGAPKKPKKKSTTLYLSERAISELKTRGKKVGLSSSEYLDEILKRVFDL